MVVWSGVSVQLGDNFEATCIELPAVVWSGASVSLGGSWIRCLPGPYPAQKGEEGKVHSCPTPDTPGMM